MKRALAILAALAAVLLGSSCAFHGLEFKNDNRLKIISPAENELVKTPIMLHWTIHGFTPAGPGQGPVNANTGYFAIFVDRAPIRPGQTMAAVNHNDPSCRHTTLCQTRSYLAGEQIYTTAKTTFKIATIADLGGNNQHTQVHDITIVLMNTAGVRVNESSWTVEFKMHANGED